MSALKRLMGMGKKPKKIQRRSSPPRNRRKSSGLPVLGLLRSVGTGMFRVFIFLSVMTVVSLFFVILYNYLLSSPYMKLERVEIRGVDENIRNDLIHMCRLTDDRSLLSLKLNALKKKMERHPWVRTATVERKFPDTLIVQIEKEKPAMLVLMDGFYYMNQQGELFKRVLGKDKMDFPILTGLSMEDPDQKIKLARAAAALSVLRNEKKTWSSQNLSEMHFDERGEISLYFNHLQAAIRIPYENMAGKMNALKKVAGHLETSGKINDATQIDLNHVDGVIVSFKKNAVSG